MDLQESVRKSAFLNGADLFGVADLLDYREELLAGWGEIAAGYLRAVSIGISLPDRVVDQLHLRNDAEVAAGYRAVYDEINEKLNRITGSLEELLRNQGYRALQVHSSRTVDRQRRYGLFSHKMAAHLAGLGWIGKSCLLITPERGPRVRWATVLTDAALYAGQPADNRCGECTLCVDACPAGAFSGIPFKASEHRDLRFDTDRCSEYLTAKRQQLGCSVLCGICVHVCPYGHGNASLQLKGK